MPKMSAATRWQWRKAKNLRVKRALPFAAEKAKAKIRLKYHTFKLFVFILKKYFKIHTIFIGFTIAFPTKSVYIKNAENTSLKTRI